MPLLFRHLCDLLSELEDISSHDPPFLPVPRYEKQKKAITRWFSKHNVSIHNGPNELVALLSAIFPAKRTDRVYCIQNKSLVKILKRSLCLGLERQAQLGRWETPGRGDLAACVERVMGQTDDPLTLAAYKLTVDDVDTALASVAAKIRFSGPKVKELENDRQLLNLLEVTYKKVHSREGKWLTRTILKDFSCLDLNENMVYAALDGRLPLAMRMFDDFEAAVTGLKSLPASHVISIGQSARTQRCADDAHLLVPRVGVKVGSARWLKAKGGVKHAVSLIEGRSMSIERKYDGEYCQIHVDIAKGKDCIQIFSKSGKDSTMDRIGVHEAIKEGLRIARSGCMFSGKCILEGELLVWSDNSKEILEFHKLRKHVSRSGSRLGTDKDSQPHRWERLMIMFYDVLLIDDDPVIHRPYDERRLLLKRIVARVEGKTDIVYRRSIDFSAPDGAQALKKILAYAIVHRWEGLVLKPAREPYFDVGKPRRGRFPARWIKLKKDCIHGLGDTADMAIIGAGYDAKTAARLTLKIPQLRWTHFYIACLLNKNAVKSLGQKPRFLVVDCVKDCMKVEDLKTVNHLGVFRQLEPDSSEVQDAFDLKYARMDPGLPRLTALFYQPFVFEIAGSGFDKSPNQDIFTLRFPRVTKVYTDRDWKDTVCLDELQEIATIARTVPIGDLRREIASWIENFNQLDCRARGQLTSWDYTDDEEEPKRAGDSPQASPASRPPRKSRTPVAPPMIRMDTREMTPNERRCSNGEVVARPTSKHSVISNDSEYILPNLLTLSPGSDGKECRKREHAESSKLPRESKRLRSAAGQLKSNQSLAFTQNATSRKRPMQELTNSTRPLHRQTETEIVQQKKISTSDLGLVRELDANQLIHHRRHVPRRRTPEPMSSPARETTASASTCATSDSLSTHSSPSAAQETAAPPQLPTPPSTREMPSYPISASIPDLDNSHIILSPCLTASPPARLPTLLADLSTQLLSLPQVQTQHFPSQSNPMREGSEIIFLINTITSNTITATALHTVARHIPAYHPRPIHIWDWQILSLAHQGGEDVIARKSREKIAEELFVARMEWCPPESPADGDGGGGAREKRGEVVVNWGDGWVTREGLETFWALERWTGGAMMGDR